MADESAAERTEDATQRKRQQARERGQVARSRDLSAACVLFVAVLFLHFNGHWMMSEIIRVTGHLIEGVTRTPIPEGIRITAISYAPAWIILFLRIMAPLLLVLFLVALVSGVGQVGFVLSFESLTLKFEKLDPIKGFKRIFSLQTLAETVKGVLKVVVLAYILKGVLIDRIPEMLDIPFLDMNDIVRSTFDSLWLLCLAGMISYIVFAAADYGFQYWEFERKQRMSRQELKEESKEQEGDPLIRARVRNIQREMARQRMMAEVPEATVVLTNPTHLAVALKYAPGMNAPKVVARGAGWLAQKIREVARENGVPVIENKPLARALHKLGLGDEISEDLYKAVAEVLALVYGRRSAGAGGRPLQAGQLDAGSAGI